ncbi:MAG: DUF3795 domain-containing protein [Proteobacteria bacterium]|nr:DUF3795 domain-containing protein [Pseudomonadota bacterium]
MKGWSEDEIRNKDLMAPCGLYCGACGIYIATRDNNEKFRGVMAGLYGTKPEETECLGCMQTNPTKNMYGWCEQCNMRNCVKEKGYYSCHQCQDWPCEMTENFGFATGVNVMKKTIPLWREKVAEHGDEEGSVEWARAECGRYHCSSCGEPLFRGAQSCRACKKPVADELDGSL